MWQPSPPDSNKLYCQSHFQTLVLQNLPLKSMVSSLLLETGIFRTSRSSGNRGPKEKKRKEKGMFIEEKSGGKLFSGRMDATANPVQTTSRDTPPPVPQARLLDPLVMNEYT